MGELLPTLLMMLGHQWTRLRRSADDGVGTLEMVIIAVGLVAVAGILVAAITSAVTSRTEQLQ